MSDRLSHDMPEAIYHADPALSSTGARALLDSPARFRWQQQHRTTSAAFDLGSAVHAEVLGTGWPVVVIDADSWRTKAAQQQRDEARAEGKVPILIGDVEQVRALAGAVLAHPAARRLLEDGGDAEVSAFAADPDTGVECKARLDYLNLDLNLAADLKTTAGSASPIGFGRDAAKYGYPVQEAWYRDVVRWATGYDVTFRFIVVEKAAPYLVAVHELDEGAALMAAEMAAKARRIYAECLAADEWPGYGDDVLTTKLPAWWFYADDDDMEVTA